MEAVEVGAVTLIVALPSPVVVIEQTTRPQPRVALPLITSKVTVTLPAGVRFGPRAVTVKGIGTPIGTVLAGAVFKVRESPVPES
jgi:hypothetical protein